MASSTTMTTLMLAFLAILSVFSLVASAPLEIRDVYVPPITYPRAGTVWKAGSYHNVTWDTSNPPKQITNRKGMIVLAKGGYLIGLSHPLASGFDILDGRHEVHIPRNTTAGDDYSVVLFGDSGNNSPTFTITK